jgi:UDP-N-acetylglucosamine/UDP-N-acetylgalactosamine diphosphorylase
MPPSVPAEIRQRLRQNGQDHVLAWWDRLDDAERRGLLEQLEAVNLDQLKRLYEQRGQTYELPSFDRIAPIPVLPPDTDNPELRRLGEEALRRGEVAVLVVAGGQGSRLGFEHPKGMFPVGPVSEKSLFQVHAEKVLALRRRYGKAVPFLVMTSPTNQVETRAFFEEHRYFGLPADEVFFFNQGTMPALDLATGKLLLEGPGRLFSSPNGHGGSLRALADSGLLERLRRQGVREVFYFQVDNPLVKVADPVFLGQHRRERAEVSSKVVPKLGPEDKLGNLVLIDGRCSIIEYSDLPKELGRQTNENGRLRFRVGSPAIHLFDVDFLGWVTRGETGMPFHVARKKVPHLDESGQVVEPEKENALKFEMFIFDVLPRADRWAVVETSRREEFEPLKNATGPDSPESVRGAISNLAGDWLDRAGVKVPRRPDSNVAVPLEVSPLFALDAGELAAKVDRKLDIRGPTYLS